MTTIKKVESWGNGRKDYTSPPVAHNKKEWLNNNLINIIGIVIATIIGIIGIFQKIIF